MSTIGSIIMLIGSGLAVLAGIGLLRFSSPYARMHAAGKASPIAFIVTAAGAAFTLDFSANLQLLLAVLAMVVTLPLGVHLLFSAIAGDTTADNAD